MYKLQTLVDGGIRLTFDLSETAIPEMAMLAECKRQGIALKVVCRGTPHIIIGKNQDVEPRHRHETYPYKKAY